MITHQITTTIKVFIQLLCSLLWTSAVCFWTLILVGLEKCTMQECFQIHLSFVQEEKAHCYLIGRDIHINGVEVHNYSCLIKHV